MNPGGPVTLLTVTPLDADGRPEGETRTFPVRPDGTVDVDVVETGRRYAFTVAFDRRPIGVPTTPLHEVEAKLGVSAPPPDADGRTAGS